MKTQVIIFNSTQKAITEDFEKFARVAYPYVSTKEVKVFASKKTIETPTIQISFKSNNEKARDGYRADITIPYDPAIMAHSKFDRKDCDLKKIFGAFCMDIENAKREHRKEPNTTFIDEMSTAATKEEFEKLLKEGKPFQLKPKHSITVASIDEAQPPIVQIQGDFKVISSMFFYALSEIMHNAEKHGMPREEIRLHFHEGVELAYNLSEL